jgi:hypothetical protein
MRGEKKRQKTNVKGVEEKVGLVVTEKKRIGGDSD